MKVSNSNLHSTTDKLPINQSDFLETVVKSFQEKKAKDILVMDLRKINTSVTDFFVICDAESSVQTKAIAMETEEHVYKNFHENPWHKEGIQYGEWIILDYVEIVAHIFKRDKRYFYGIEELWGDARIKRIV